MSEPNENKGVLNYSVIIKNAFVISIFAKKIKKGLKGTHVKSQKIEYIITSRYLFTFDIFYITVAHCHRRFGTINVPQRSQVQTRSTNYSAL